MKAFIVSFGFDEMKGLASEKVFTESGEIEVFRGEIEGEKIIILPRRRRSYDVLPSHINFLGNLTALKQLGADAVVSLSTVGVFDPMVELGTPIVPDDVFFPDNRLPDGNLCTVFQKRGKDCGHLIADSLFNEAINDDLSSIFPEAVADVVHVHSSGPRFNTKSEIAYFKNAGGAVISQTSVPEAVLANELELPYGQLLFAVDYVNGIETAPVSSDELQKNLQKSKDVFERAIREFTAMKKHYNFENVILRF